MTEPAIASVLGVPWELPDEAMAALWSRCLVSSPGLEPRRLPGEHLRGYAWTSRVTVASILERAGHWLLFHAAGVSNEHGEVAALIGPSGVGKSTAARRLCRRDFGYVTDETVGISAEDQVVAYPKPISMVAPEGGPKVEVGPDELGLLHCAENLRLRGMVVLERNEEHVVPTWTRLKLFDGIMAILPETSALSKLPTPLATVARAAERCGGIFRVRYADSGGLADCVRAVIAARPIKPGIVHHRVSEAPTPGPVEKTSVLAIERVVRTTYIDAIELDDELLVLRDTKVIRLQGLGTIIWKLVPQPRQLSDLLIDVVAAAGDHPDAERVLRQAVAAMGKIGVLAQLN